MTLKEKLAATLVSASLLGGAVGYGTAGAPISCQEDTSQSVHARLFACEIPANERAAFKGREIAKIGPKARSARKDYDIEIVEINAIEKGVEVFARAWKKNGEQIGFGRDGTVDIERFVIVNPPVLVPDPDGEKTRIIDGATYKYREDTKEAVLQVVEQSLKEMKKLYGANKIVLGKRGKTTYTVYPDAHVESSTVDGEMNANNSTFAGARAATQADSSNDDGSGLAAYTKKNVGSSWVINRAFTYFNTGVVPADSTIDSATVSLYGISVLNQEDDGNDFIGIVQVDGANVVSDTALNTADFDLSGTTQGATAIDIGSINTSGYNDWTLNATGLTWIARSGEQKPTGGTAGITYLGWREGHDLLNDALNGDPVENRATFMTADNAGTTNDPKLVIETAAPVIPPSPKVPDIIILY